MFKGNNTLTLNSATIAEALTEYLSKRVKDDAPIFITQIRMDPGASQNFIIDISDVDSNSLPKSA